MKRVILSIDCGTQSMRTLLFSEDGTLLDSEQVEYAPYYSDNPGWAEQDPELFWNSLVAGCRALQTRCPEHMATIQGVGITTQRATMISVDKNGSPLRPAIIWLDQRRTEGLEPVGGLWGLAFRLAGMRETVAQFQAEAEVNWLQRHQPEVWNRTHK